MSGFYTFNENLVDCNDPSHTGVEVIYWPYGGCSLYDVEVMAVCRDEATASLLTDALNAQQVPGQTEIETVASVEAATQPEPECICPPATFTTVEEHGYASAGMSTTYGCPKHTYTVRNAGAATHPVTAKEDRPNGP